LSTRRSSRNACGRLSTEQKTNVATALSKEALGNGRASALHLRHGDRCLRKPFTRVAEHGRIRFDHLDPFYPLRHIIGKIAS
jgi:hypothetical protein